MKLKLEGRGGEIKGDTKLQSGSKRKGKIARALSRGKGKEREEFQLIEKGTGKTGDGTATGKEWRSNMMLHHCLKKLKRRKYD